MWIYPLSMITLVLVLLVLGLYFFAAVSTVLLGLLAATIVACALNPAVAFIPGPRALSAVLLGLGLMAAAASLIFALSWPLAGPINRALEDWPTTKRTIDEHLTRWDRWISGTPAPAGQPGQPAAPLVAPLPPQNALTVDELLKNIGQFFTGDRGTLLFSRGADVVMAILVWLVFVFIGSIFLLADPHERLLAPGLLVVSGRYRPAVREMLGSLSVRLRRWAIGTLISMMIVFTASWIGYTAVGLKVALPLAILAGLCEIVPTVGPAVACIVATIFAAATQAHPGPRVVGVLAVYAIIQGIEAYIILPMIMRGAVKIHPAVTLFTVVLWGKIFGVPGLMLAIPINLTIASAIEHLYVRPRDEGRWAGEKRPADRSG